MTIDEAIQYFGNLHRTVLALGLRAQNMTKWKRYGYIPMLQQYRLAELTNGELVPDKIDPRTIRKQQQEKAIAKNKRKADLL